VIVRALLGFLLATAVGALLGCPITGPGVTARSEAPLVLPDVSEPSPPSRVVVVSIAGFAPADYEPAAGASPAMPSAAVLAERGVAALATLPISPRAVYPAHATLVTGRHSDAHAIAADRLLGDRGVRSARFWHASRLDGESLWQVALDSGLGVVSLGWPSTLGAAIPQLLPDIEPVRDEQSWSQALAGATTPWILERITELTPPGAGAEWPSAADRDALVVDLACDVARQPSPPQLWLLRLAQTGAALRHFGPDSARAREARARVDAELVQLLRCLSDTGLLPTSALVLLGDRAIAPVHSLLAPNTQLLQAGLIQRDPRSPNGLRGWSAIVRSNGGSGYVYARSESAALEARKVLEKAAVESGAFRIVSARDLRTRRSDPRAWFGLDAAPGYTFGDTAFGDLVSASLSRGAGGHEAAGADSGVGFVAWGRGIRSGVQIPLLPQVDIAPTVATMLGLRLRRAEGRTLVGALQLHPPGSSLIVPSSRPPPGRSPGPPVSGSAGAASPGVP